MTRSRRASWPLLAAVALAGCEAGWGGSGLGPDGQAIPTVCEPGNTATLAVGEVREFRGTLARYFCVEPLTSEPEDFLLVLFEASESSRNLTLLPGNVASPSGPPLPAPPPAIPVPPTSDPEGEATPDAGFHAQLRDMEVRELGALVGTGVPDPSPPRTPTSPPQVGQIVTYNAQANPDNLPNGACDIPLPVQARIEAVSERAIIAADISNPSGGFTAADYQSFAAAFDTLIAPVAEAHFGTPTNVGGTGRVILLFTREVNRLTPPGAESFTAGFFFARDLFPRQSTPPLAGCRHSNEAEILYLMVPDPEGTVNGNRRTRSFVLGFTPSTIIHEHQHLINAGRRLLVQRLPGDAWSEESWLNEALSHVAEELLFHAASGLGPGRNISALTLGSATSPRTIALNRYQRFNLRRFFEEFLPSVESTSPFSSSVSLATRGAAWHLLRYLADRQEGDQAAFFRTLVDGPARGVQNLGAALGGVESFYDWMGDWRIALYADDRVPGLSSPPVARHQDVSWHLPSMHNFVMQPGQAPYPIAVRTLAAARPESVQLAPGAAAYFRFSAPGPGPTALQATASGGLPPSSVRALLLRTR